MKIKVIDDIMGGGKTSYAIQMMNEAPQHQKFIYITPFLDEVERIKSSVTTRTFKDPKAISGLKLEGLKRLLVNGENIVSTHALFRRCDQEVLELLRMSDYTLILDEVMEIVEPVNIVRKDMDTLLSAGFIKAAENGLVSWSEDFEYNGAYKEFKDYAVNGKLFFIHDKLFMWAFNVDVFTAFKEAYLLTYMFNGQLQKAYFDLFDVEYQYKSVEKIGDRYNLIDYIDRSRSHLKPLVNIFEGGLNKVGEGFYHLSATKQKTFKSQKHAAKLVQNSIYNFFNYRVKGKSDDNMWTCLKDAKTVLSGNGYKKGYVPNNCRATNQHSHKTNLAYIYNKFVDTDVKKFFEKNNTMVDEELYAVSELVQWIWRSAIRNNQPINLYIPSSRMRELLYKWLNDEI